MDVENLVRMANRIGDFFQAMPDREEGREGIAQHLRRFWEPRMRRSLLSHLDETGGADLDPIVREALLGHRHLL